MIGTSDQSCWLAEACKILLLLQMNSLVGWQMLVKSSHFFSASVMFTAYPM